MVSSCEQLQLPDEVGGEEALALLLGQAEWTPMPDLPVRLSPTEKTADPMSAESCAVRVAGACRSRGLTSRRCLRGWCCRLRASKKNSQMQAARRQQVASE